MAIIDRSKKKFVVDRNSDISIGIDLPFRLSNVSGSGYFSQTSTTSDAIKNNIKNLINTERGERLLQPTLGIALKKYLFEQINNDTVTAIQTDISAAFDKWLPFVNIKDILVDFAETDNSIANRISVSITFFINRDPNSLDSVHIEIGG